MELPNSTAPEAAKTAGNPGAGPEVAPDVEIASEGVSGASEAMPDGDGPDGSERDADGGKRRRNPAREAAQYRAELRETRSQLEAVTARLEATQMEIARKLAEAAGLVSGDELNVPVSELLDEKSGLVDAGKVRNVVAALVKEKPYLRRVDLPRMVPVNGQGQNVVEAYLENQGTSRWSDLLRH